MDASVTMWKARAIDPVLGRPITVQVRGTELEQGAHYYSAQFHKGKLCCAYCDAVVHHNEGSNSVLGSFNGRDPHFVTNRDETHKSCLWKLRKPTQSLSDIDPTKGYRVHLNTQEFSHLFNKSSGAYTIGKNGRVQKNDERLAGMESLSVTSVRDLVTLLEKGEYDRINKSLVIFRNEIIDWNQFCIHHGKYERFFDLLDRASKADSQTLPYCLIEIRTDKSYSFNGFGKQQIRSQPVLMADRDNRGKKQEMQPTIEMRNRDNTLIMNAFSLGAGSYFVISQVRYNRFEGDFKTIHYFNIPVTSLGQVEKANIDNIVEKGLARMQARANQPVPRA